VSVAFEKAEFPLTGGADRHTLVEGAVLFQDVEFIAGTLADDLLGFIGREPKASLKLNQPVALVIADRRVRTEGMAIPLGNLTELNIGGWVDFDRNLRLTASLPFTRKMVGNVALLGDIVEGTKVSVPISGTLDRPKIDGDAMALGLKDLGKTMLERTAGRGASELFMRLLRPRDPNAPPPPPPLTPQERRARRQQQRDDRRMRREAPPEFRPN
jgi:translocation and assembly module TamB